MNNMNIFRDRPLTFQHINSAKKEIKKFCYEQNKSTSSFTKNIIFNLKILNEVLKKKPKLKHWLNFKLTSGGSVSVSLKQKKPIPEEFRSIFGPLVNLVDLPDPVPHRFLNIKVYWLGTNYQHVVFSLPDNKLDINCLFDKSNLEERRFLEKKCNEALLSNKLLKINIINCTCPEMQKIIKKYQILNTFS